ncbi:MAG: hypothetical protein ACLTYN_07990 [Dysosmobacter welbionis]
MDVDSGRVLYEQNADAKMLIASTTKISDGPECISGRET